MILLHGQDRVAFPSSGVEGSNPFRRSVEDAYFRFARRVHGSPSASLGHGDAAGAPEERDASSVVSHGGLCAAAAMLVAAHRFAQLEGSLPCTECSS